MKRFILISSLVLINVTLFAQIRVIVNSEGPCYEGCAPYPIVENFDYMTADMYNITIEISNNILPGNGALPPMYLVAYLEDLKNVVGARPLFFEAGDINDQGVITLKNIILPITNFEQISFSNLLIKKEEIITYKISLAYLIDEQYYFYSDSYPELFSFDDTQTNKFFSTSFSRFCYSKLGLKNPIRIPFNYKKVRHKQN